MLGSAPLASAPVASQSGGTPNNYAYRGMDVSLAKRMPGQGTYNLNNSVANYSYVGTPAVMSYGDTFVLPSGFYALTGQNLSANIRIVFYFLGYNLNFVTPPVILLRNRAITLGGNVPYTGQAISMHRSFAVADTAGNYSYAGTAPTLTASYTMALAAGNYARAATSTTLRRNYKTLGSTMNYAYVGNSVSVAQKPALQTVTGVYRLTTPTTSLKKNSVVVLSNSNYVINGRAVTLGKTSRIPLVTGTYAYVGISGSLKVFRLVTTAAGNYSYTGQAATLSRSFPPLIVTVGGIVFGPKPAVLQANRAMTAGQGNYGLIAQALSAVYKSVIPTGTSVSTNDMIVPSKVTQSTSGGSGTSPSNGIIAATGNYAQTGQAMTLLKRGLP